LRDRRTLGNHRRLTDKAANFLRDYHAAHPNSTLLDYQALLKTKLGIKQELLFFKLVFFNHKDDA